MFDDHFFRKLEELAEGVRVPIEVPLDEDGYYDRICHGDECGALFKVLFDDWRDKVSDEVVYCPICRHKANSSEWNTDEQDRHIADVGLNHVHKEMDDAFGGAAERFNRSQRGGEFITLSMSYQPDPLPIIVPAQISEVMRQKSTCEKCGCRYSSIGAAFFCPACGHNSAETTFDGSVETVRKTLDALELVQDTISKAIDPDTATDSMRQMIENGLVKLVSSFQRFAEARFDALPNRASFKPRRNLFQNLAESNDIWRAAVGAGYDAMLTPSEHDDLERYFQQRHLLAHKEGIVDQQYVDRSGDHRYSVGQRLVIRSESVRQLADLIAKLAGEIRART